MNMTNKCRTCFNESSKGTQSLTETITDNDSQQRTFAELLNELANINIHNDIWSTLPQIICGCCSRKLKDAHAFVQQAQEVNEKLYSMFFQQSDEVCKPLDCLQEIQIDIEPRVEIKMEGENVYDQNCGGDVSTEADLIKRDIKLKEEVPEEDTLSATVTTNEGIGKFLGSMTPPDILTSQDMYDNESNIPDSSQNIVDVFDNNTSNKSSGLSASDDDDWQNKSYNSTTNSEEKKTKPSKKLKLSKTEDRGDKEKNNNEDELQVKCNDCDKIFANSRLLIQHQRRNHVPDELKIQCLHCEAKFSRRHNMYSHMRRIHKTENLEAFQITPKKLNTEKQFACQECPRSYTNKYKLIAHVNSHHNPATKMSSSKKKILQPKKRFLCTLCGLKFDSTGHLNIHSRCHTGEKPFKCEFCDRSYPRLYDVTVHRRTHTGEKPYQCTLCEKTFRNSNKLTVHMRTHTNERPYKCTQCEKAFKQSKDLNIHKRTHTGERPYKCCICHSTFTQSNSLRLHQIKQHHLEKANGPNNLTELTTH